MRVKIEKVRNRQKNNKRDYETKSLSVSDKNTTAGITLIGLIVTIIVLLILAGLSIAMITGDNGIIKQTYNAKEKAEKADEKEALQITMVHKERTNDSKYDVGETLRDRTLANGDNWKIVSVNETKEIYGTGWIYVAKGTELKDYGKTKYYWIINEDTGEIIELPENGVTKLAYGDNLAVKDGLILNADPINMGNEESWGEGVTVYGIQEGDGYGWNETEFKLDGVDDYIEVYPSDQVNIEKGFTFEFYANSEYEQICMLAKTIKDGEGWSNRFRTSMVNTNNFRCCMSSYDSMSSWRDTDIKNGHWIKKEINGDFKGEDGGYITMVTDIEKNTISLYWNGEFVDSTTCSHKWMINGDLTDNSIPFTIGFIVQGDLYSETYSKMNLFACRLYNKILTADEVKDNYNATVAYHNLLVEGNH